MKTLFIVNHIGKTGWDSKIGSYVQFKCNGRMIRGRLMEDYEKANDGVMWIMQRASCLKSEYTELDRFENKMYDEAEILEDGETVEILKLFNYGETVEFGGKGKYIFHALGDYSDCGKFEKIGEQIK